MALVYKTSNLEQGALYFFQKDYCENVLDYIDEINPKKEHSFIPIYMISTIYNVLLAEANQDDIVMDVTRYSKILKQLVDLLKKDLPGACYTAILEIIKAFNRFNPRWEDFEIEAKIKSTLRDYLNDFENVFKGKLSRNTIRC